MSKPPEVIVKNLTEFTAEIERRLLEVREKYKGDQTISNWYRGCGLGNSHKLVPGLYRHPKLTKDDMLLLERKMVDWFKRESVLQQTLNKIVYANREEIELLFFMQHYGVPTRLLDWTMNPYIALYFALTSAERDAEGEFKENASVWIMNPEGWNGYSLNHLNWKKGPLVMEDDAITGYAPLKDEGTKKMLKSPVAVRGIANSTRMFAQKGVFTIFGQDLEPMETIYETGFPAHSLSRIVIEKDEIDQMLIATLSIGYTDSVAYPDLHGLAMEMRRQFGFIR